MKRIELLENLKEKEDFEKNKIDYNFYRAYKKTRELDLAFINFDNIGFIGNLEETMDNLERFDIKEFTISDQTIGLIQAVEGFQKKGYFPTGLMQIETESTNWNFEEDKEEKEITPAVHFRRI